MPKCHNVPKEECKYVTVPKEDTCETVAHTDCQKVPVQKCKKYPSYVNKPAYKMHKQCQIESNIYTTQEIRETNEVCEQKEVPVCHTKYNEECTYEQKSVCTTTYEKECTQAQVWCILVLFDRFWYCLLIAWVKSTLGKYNQPPRPIFRAEVKPRV